MTLKTKISLLISTIFSVLFACAALIIFTLFSNFRKAEFESRLKEKAYSSIRLLVEVEQVDRQLLKIIDQNSINKLYDEKTLIFDANYKLIYSSLDDTKIDWNIDDLKYLKQHKTFFKKSDQYEVYGVFYDTNDKDYYALISASDNYGKRKLEYLSYTLLIACIIFSSLCWFITFYAVKKLLLPLDNFHAKVKTINEKNLDTRLEVNSNKNEIDLLGSEFNQMLHRIDRSYQQQKEFTAHASHELRTPVARVNALLQNKLLEPQLKDEERNFFRKLLADINQIAELISSLLLLAKLDDKATSFQSSYRVDEIIYACIDKLHQLYPAFRIKFDFDDQEDIDDFLTVKGSQSLLEIAFINLLKNACMYSSDQSASILIGRQHQQLRIHISNRGNTISVTEQEQLFQPFMRGENAKGRSGIGLGLRIVQRILHQHKATIQYSAIDHNTNSFTILFSH